MAIDKPLNSRHLVKLHAIIDYRNSATDRRGYVLERWTRVYEIQ